MITAAVDAGVPARWLTADEVYGNEPVFRAGVQALGPGYILAVARHHRVAVNHGATGMRADQIADGLPDAGWQTYSAGTGWKGPGWYAWAWIEASTADQPGQTLLIGGNTSAGELASTAAGRPPRSPCPRWCGWPARAGV